jgi:5-methylcytosine-specific restriction protein A
LGLFVTHSIDAFRAEIREIKLQASELGIQTIEITAGSIHRRVGGYPAKKHRIPTCCNAMRAEMQETDQVLPNNLKN